MSLRGVCDEAIQKFTEITGILMKKQIGLILNNRHFEKFIIILILLNVFIFIFETDEFFYLKCHHYIQSFELFSVIVFSIEYFLRVLSLKKIKNLFKPLMIVDLLAILPFYLSFAKVNTVFFRVLRLFRLLRVAKITRYIDALTDIKRAFLLKKEELTITGLIFLAGLTIFSILIYYAEHNTGQKSFSSIPSCFWWAIITFTSVGYGDVCPITSLGKFIASFAAVLGLCFNGLLIGIISSAFIETLAHKKVVKSKIKENNKEFLFQK